VVADDLCTGSRQLTVFEPAPAPAPAGDLWPWLARQILRRPPCARTLGSQPGRVARQVLEAARSSGARGVIVHAMKFCDPTLARLPEVRKILREAGLPLLVLEGDCSQRSLGQQRTRLQAFAEMLAGSPAQAPGGPAR
jgi:benzoyl-CoA reductase/2-hydroxyglutaryl-CoA dehydratase subunit BcrC/BadD/HgdB